MRRREAAARDEHPLDASGKQAAVGNSIYPGFSDMPPLGIAAGVMIFDGCAAQSYLVPEPSPSEDILPCEPVVAVDPTDLTDAYRWAPSGPRVEEEMDANIARQALPQNLERLWIIGNPRAGPIGVWPLKRCTCLAQVLHHFPAKPPYDAPRALPRRVERIEGVRDSGGGTGTVAGDLSDEA